jgi:capsular exopolysaccharide synthesis family protein
MAESPAAPPASGHEPSSSRYVPQRTVHLWDYVRVLHKRRWTIIPAFTAVVLFMSVKTFTTTPIYEARTTVLIEPENQNVVNIEEVVQEEGGTDYYQTQYGLLRSRALARKAVQELKLWNDPGFGGGPPQKPGFSVMGTARSAVRTIIGLFTAPENDKEAPQPDETIRESAVISGFLGQLEVVSTRGTRLVDLQFRSPDPALAAKALNTLTRLYIDQNLEFRLSSSRDASDWLIKQLTDQRKAVEAAEQALQAYRENNDALSLDEGQNIVGQELTDLNSALTKAKTVRLEKEGLYEQLRLLQANSAALDTFPAIMSNPVVQQLKSEVAVLLRQKTLLAQTFGEKHPQMEQVTSSLKSTEARLEAEVGKIVESVRQEFVTARNQEGRLLAALNAQKQAASGLNQSGIEYGVLKREAESTREIYQTLLQRAKETGVSAELKTNNVRVIDAAEPPRSPILPRTRLDLMLAVFGGGLFAIALGFLFEYFDNRIKGPDEIRLHLGLPFLGLIPVVAAPGKDGDRSAKLITNAVPQVFAEAFRTVRTNILFSSAEEGPRSVLVTSSVPNEGKTIVASNLAVGLAQAGSRVLLMDADMRLPKVHVMFEVPAEPGLSNLLVGDAKVTDAVRKTTVPGLWILAGGRVPPNPAELLGAPRFKEFLTALREHFDWIVIDSPPVMPVTDASVIAHLTSGVLFVVGAEMTNRAVARHAIERLDSAHGRFFGAVLNKADIERNSYYYAEYYRREYDKYYVTP